MKNKLWIPTVIVFLVMFSTANIAAYEITYTYDDLNRLTAATYSDGTGRKTVTYQYDAIGNKLARNVLEILAGDVNGDSAVTLADAIMAIQVAAGITTGQSVVRSAEISGDGRIGLSEAIYILQRVAGMR